MALWDTVPPPNYATYNPNVVGNALGNLVSNYQGAQQGANRNQQDQMLLDQQKAFVGGVPMNPNGTPNYSQILKTLAQKGDIGAINSLGPLIQQQQQIDAGSTPSSLWGGAGASIDPGGGGFMGALHQAESGNQNILSTVDPDPAGPGTRSQGYDQINVPTWRDFAPKAGVDLSQYPTPMSAPEDVQDKVAAQIPLGRFGPRTRKMLESQFGFGDDEKSQTVGQLAARFGGGATGGTKVASAGASDTPMSLAYANPEAPSIPPVSAAAGSSIPRADAATAAGAVGAPNAQPAAPGQAPGNLLAQAAQIPTALPAASSAAAAPSNAAPQAPDTTVAGIVSGAVDGPQKHQVAQLVAKALRVDPGAPLTPEQAARAKTIVQNYAARTGAQPPAGGQGQAPAGGPILPQVRLPNGFKPGQEQDAILAIDQEMSRLASSSNPKDRAQVPFLADWRDRIAQSTAPMEVRPGETLLDPRNRQVLFQASPSSASNLALQRFLTENPDASAEQIQAFQQAGRGGARSGVGMYMQRFLQENPNASAEEVAKAAQDFQSSGSALTKFTSGPQGNSIRSFNVLVDHLGTLADAATALKNGNMQLFNRVAQGFAQQTGEAAPTNFDAVKGIVGDELVKAIVGGGGALGDREDIKATVDKANSPKQLAGVIEQYKKLALGQLRGLGKQYSEATGRDDFDRFLAPGTRAFFGDKSGGDKGSGQDVGLPPGWSVEVH